MSASLFDTSNLFLEGLIRAVHASLQNLIIEVNVAGIESSIVRDTILLDAINAQNNNIAGLVDFVLADIFDAIQDITLDGTDNTDDIVNAIVDAINASNNAQTQTITRSDDAVTRTILDALSVESTTQIDSVRGIIQPILNSNDAMEETLLQMSLWLFSNITESSQKIDGIVDFLSNGINTTINNRIVLGEGLLDGLLRDITEIFRIAINAQVLVAQGSTQALLRVIRDQIAKEELLGTLEVNELKRLVDIFLSFQGPQLENYDLFKDRSIDGLGGVTSSGAFEQLARQFGLALGPARDKVDQTLFDKDNPSADDLCGLISWRSTWVDTDVPNFLGEIVVWIISAIMTPMNAAQIKANIVMQEYRKCNPDSLIPPGDLSVALRRTLINEDRAVDDIQKQGFTEDDAKLLLNVAQIFPDLNLILAMWHRKLVSEDTLDAVLKSDGYTKPFADAIKEAAFFLAPIQDLITMAVREVFTPEIAEAQGQFDDFPEEFARQVALQGVNRDLARDYWAAHWQLPSIQMGFEMLHRGVIDDKKLDDLQRALDVMPGWRDSIKAISFSPFTRVDIRRMNKVGVLTEAEVKRAYMDIGYDDEKSDKLTAFTLELNKDEGLLTLNIASDLTRSNIVGFYVEGILDRGVALALLLQAGINVVAAELFLQDADIGIERKVRRDSIGIVMDRFKFGAISFNEAQNQLAALGLEEQERNLASVELLKAKEQLTKIPSRSDLDKFLGAGLIDPSIYIETMELNGYSAFWSEKYLQLNTGEQGNGDDQITNTGVT